MTKHYKTQWLTQSESNGNVTSLYFNTVSTWIYLALLHPGGVTERGTEGSELRTGHRNPRKTLIIHQPLPQMKKCPKQLRPERSHRPDN